MGEIVAAMFRYIYLQQLAVHLVPLLEVLQPLHLELYHQQQRLAGHTASIAEELPAEVLKTHQQRALSVEDYC
jgi:hypothetical protein